ncbi:hypothetical protein [Paraburkholderia tropica]|uniref:hypothetical protein n=1 Tax=Paraburkholderia tropica TaxID=92647 RepID=UPI002AB7C5FE|nr:hypothetical protein [Paraburkholderia tropica]
MTFNAVSALTEADGIYPVQPLQVDTRNTARGNGGMSYRARMRTPLDTDDSTPVSFSFVDGKLIGFSVELDDSHFARAMTQIVDKYGKGELADDRKDEQCLYRNGANFKVNWGALSHRWTQRISDNTVIQTSATEFTVAMCPPSLDGPALEPSTSHHISFDEIVSAPKPTSNPF